MQAFLYWLSPLLNHVLKEILPTMCTTLPWKKYATDSSNSIYFCLMQKNSHLVGRWGGLQSNNYSKQCSAPDKEAVKVATFSLISDERVLVDSVAFQSHLG